MTTVAELSIPAEEFALEETFEECDDLEVDVVRGVAQRTPGMVNLGWVSAAERDRADAALRDDGTVGEVARLGDIDGRWLHSMDWKTPVAVAIAVLLKHATMLGASAKRGVWSFRVLFPQPKALSIAASLFEEYTIELHIECIYELGEAGESGDDLTETQREALRRALREGYFKIPRNSMLGAIADDLDISHQALSERLRRANELLAEAALPPVDTDEKRELQPD